MSKVSLLVHDVPANVRAAVEQDCRDRDASLTDVVGSIVASRYGIPWSASGYPFRGIGNTDAPWVIRVPGIVRVRLADEANATGGAVGRIVVATLAEHYGLPVPSTRDRRGRNQARDEAGRFVPRQKEGRE